MSTLRLLRTAGLIALPALALASNTVQAQASLVSGLGGTAGYGTSCLGENDDGSSSAISLTSYFPSGLNFFGTTQTQMYVNTNGNITFAGNLPTYTASAFPISSQPMIAPFWADVDTRQEDSGWFATCTGPGDGEAVIGAACDNPSQDGIWWWGESGRLVITWDRVGYYQCHTDLRNSFQLILTAAEGCAGSGDFDVEFRYHQCQWESGDASGGSDGFGGTQAQAGFDAGDGTNYVMIEGSRAAGIANHLCTSSNVGETGVWRFQVRSGVIICPDAGDACTVSGAIGACAEGRTNCVGSGTECVQQVEPSEERCDNVDNDCDGSTDEDDSLCPSGQQCLSGVCTDICFEGSCPDGYSCTDEGCVETSCIGVTCSDGQRCAGGSCIGACDGVVCPSGQTCTGGHCYDACAGLTCDECTVCDSGACVSPCTTAGCSSGQSCDSDTGLCVESACVGVTCSTGTTCIGGACVDACTGVVCPYGQSCHAGECTTDALPDAGMWVAPDASFEGVDGGGGVLPGTDGGTGIDGGSSRRPSRSTGCGCRAGESSSSPLGAALFLGIAAIVAQRRRR